MSSIEPFGLHAKSWQFLADPGDYIAASRATNRPLVDESTRRQFATAQAILARLNGSQGEIGRKGLLLADDVGLGKTTVAALVAWVVAGKDRSVRVLAPNAVMKRRWAEELTSHIPMLERCASHLGATQRRVRIGAVQRLNTGSIHVATHHYASQESNLKCDLLIVDEAHRAKGDGTSFSRALRAQSGRAKRVLILTATPLSIDPAELERLMDLIGAPETKRSIRAYSRALNDFYSAGAGAGSPTDRMAKRIAERAKAAVEALAPVLIRHGVSDLPLEKSSFGKLDSWTVPVRAVSDDELEVLLRMDRMLRVVRHRREGARTRTNDPRFHVGWLHVRAEIAGVGSWLDSAQGKAGPVIGQQLSMIQAIERRLGVHPKMESVADEVMQLSRDKEKVLLFCHHHATAQELTCVLRDRLPRVEKVERASAESWHVAWSDLLPSQSSLGERVPRDFDRLRETFISWLSTPALRHQVGSWIDSRLSLKTAEALTRALRTTKARRIGSATVGEAAAELLLRLIDPESASTINVLRAALRTGDLALLPGGDGTRILAACEAPKGDAGVGFLGLQQPDTAIAVFNSPFGPDILVATDRLSEGIDLHRYCRHLIHYELDASPIRTIQRNGRLRRVNSWAAATGEPLRYAYPAFGGTRDHRLVLIMKRRVDAFSMLLGGVPDFNVDAVTEGEELWRDEVLRAVRRRLEHLNGRLAVPR